MFARRQVCRRDERGAILPLTVFLLATTMTLASLVIDIGGDRVVRRDMQAVADVVALDLARTLDGRAAGGYTGYSATAPSSTLLATEKAESLGRQGGLITTPNAITVRLAIVNQQTGAFLHWAAAAEVPNAVRVYATGSSAFRLLPTTPSSSNLQRSALAVTGQPLVCISAGATLADLQPGGTLDLLLGRLIGLDRLSIVSPSGVASLSAQVPLGSLATQLGLGTVDQLATASVTGRSFLQAAATVLSNNGDVAAADVLNAIAARVNGTTNINLSSIFSLSTGKGSAVGLKQEAFGLAEAIIEVSNMNNFVDIGVPSGVSGLLPLTFRAKIIQPPQIACGEVGTRAHSSQIQLSLTADDTGVVGIVASAKINPLLLTFGDGWAEINEITCNPSVTRIRLSGDTAVGLFKLHLDVGILGGLSVLKVDVPDPDKRPNGAEIGKSHTNPVTFNFNPGGTEIPPSQTVGNSMQNLGLQNTTPVKTEVLGLPLGGLNNLLNTLLSAVDGHLNTILNPVLTGLGLRLGTVEVRPTSRPSCNELVLRD
jgi:uncharacterized membrane protein